MRVETVKVGGRTEIRILAATDGEEQFVRFMYDMMAKRGGKMLMESHGEKTDAQFQAQRG